MLNQSRGQLFWVTDAFMVGFFSCWPISLHEIHRAAVHVKLKLVQLGKKSMNFKYILFVWLVTDLVSFFLPWPIIFIPCHTWRGYRHTWQGYYGFMLDVRVSVSDISVSRTSVCLSVCHLWMITCVMDFHQTWYVNWYCTLPSITGIVRRSDQVMFPLMGWTLQGRTLQYLLHFLIKYV